MGRIHLNHLGTWKEPTKLYVNNAGAWVEPTGGYIKAAGVWEKFYPSPFAGSTLDLDFTVSPMASPGAADPYFGSVVYLSGYEGADTSTTTIDEAKGKTVTSVGNAQIDTAQKKFGASSLLLDGTGDYVTLADHADWDLGTDPFTIEGWFRFSSLPSPLNVVLLGQWSVSAPEGWILWLLGGQMFLRTSGNTDTTQYFFTPTVNTWYHIAIDREAPNIIRLYVDGVMRAKTTGITYNLSGSVGALSIGSLLPSYSGFDFPGWVDEVRITKGVARYASDAGYTVPTAAFPRWGTPTSGLDPRITFSRASLGTYYDSAGVLKYAGHNNYWWSEDFTQSIWTKASGVTITADATTAPDGTTADRLNWTTAGTTTATYIWQNLSPVWTDRCLVSIYAKAGSKPFLMIGSSATGATWQIWFNLTTGTLGTVGAGAGVISGAIADAGNGWYRCSALMTAAGWGGTAYIRPGETNGVVTCSSPGDIYLWGAQCEYVSNETTPRAYIKTLGAAVHGPRFDHDPVTHVAKGLLIEEARTSAVLTSQDFTHANWVKTGVTVTGDQIIAPDGTTTADLVTASASTATLDQSLTVSATVAYTVSVFAKKGSSDWFYIAGVITITGPESPKAYFNLATGAVGTIDANITAATIQDVGNGWYRCVMTRLGTAGNERTMFGVCDANGSATATAGKTIYLWGAQVDSGGTFASSYIPAGTSAALRAADVAVMTGSNFSSWYSQSQGTFVAEYVTFLTTGVTKTIAQADDNTSAEYVSLWLGSGNGPTVGIKDNNVLQAQIAIPPNVPANTIHKLGISFALNDIAGCSNGGTVSTDTAATMPTPTQLRIGGDGVAADYIQGYIRRIRFFNTAKSDADLQALTT